MLLAFLESEAGELIEGIEAAWLPLIRRTLAGAASEGLSLRTAGRYLSDTFAAINRRRANLWARTELLRGSNLASLRGAGAIAAETGLDVEKEWLAVLGDGRTRESHEAAHGQRVPLDGLFQVGGHEAAHLGAASLPVSESAACRCAMGWHVLN